MEEFEGESVVLTELEDALRNKTPALLSKSLFSETDIIRLPVQLNPFTEANLRNALWYALREYNVRGEANLKGGRIDLLCEHAGLKIGIECKSDFKNVGEKDFGYEAFVDAFYLASFGGVCFDEEYEFSLDYLESKVTGRASALELLRRITFGEAAVDMRGRTLGEVVEHIRAEGSRRHEQEKKRLLKDLMVKYRNGIHFPKPYGVLLYHPFGELWVAKSATAVRKTSGTKARRSTSTEAFINFSVWKHFMEQGYIVTSESELPHAKWWDVVVKRVNVRTKLGIGIPREIRQPVLRGHGRIDVVAMPRSCINEVDSSKVKVVGVECKASDRGLSRLEEQLNSYIMSKDVSHLYVAVPERYERKLRGFLRQFPSVGLLAITKHGVEEVKEAEGLELRDLSMMSVERRVIDGGGKFRERLYVGATDL